MKQFTIFGIILMLFGLGLLYESSAQFTNSISNNTLQSISVGQNSTTVLPVKVSNSTLFGIFYSSNSTRLTYYLFNQSAFSQVSRYLNSSTLLNKSSRLEGKGVYEIVYNSASGVFPYQNISAPVAPSYYYNGTAIISNGTYYNVFQNLGNSNTLIYYSIIKRLQVSLNSSMVTSSALSFLGFLSFIGGVILLIYSLFIKKEPKEQQPEATTNPDIDRLYAKYSEHRKRNKHKKQSKR